MMPYVYVWCRHQSLSRNIPYHAKGTGSSHDVVWDALISNPQRERHHCTADSHSVICLIMPARFRHTMNQSMDEGETR